LSFIPGGVLVTEASLLGLLVKNGVLFGVASTVVLFLRFVTLWFYTIIGFLTLKLAFKESGSIN